MADTNKTEKATTKKRNDERKKGNVFKSRDVVSVVSLFIGFFLAVKMGGYMSAQVRELYLYVMDSAGSMDTMSIADSGVLARRVVTSVFAASGPILAAMFLVAIVVHGAQTKFLVAPELLKFKFNRINPIEGIKRLFSVRSLVELVKSVIKIAVVMWLVYSTIMGLLEVAPDLLNTQMDIGLAFMLDEIMKMVYIVCLIFVGVAALDFFYQRYDYERKLRMSKQEVKDEFKQMEGDPMIKGKRREKQREISMNRMMQQVPQADVVVRNPTHFAVALKYDIDKDPAPIVLAKGQDHVALRIVSLAEQSKVLISENPSLARSLYGAAKVNEYIPPGLYNAVAEVMAWVYGQQKREIAPEAAQN
ncbi:MAG: flagellar biosynthesis protein FlhB [Clostridiales Family XIII bacterium]|jgi:flagellar biosynthetic protein FlhB|nr:flagellar biosynthesis protein FlhB [Clostridiales Family XIII bacterium]